METVAAEEPAAPAVATAPTVAEAGKPAVALPERISASRRRDWVCRLVLALAVFATFFPALKHGFLPWDDAELITRNPHIHAPYGAGLRTLWTQAYDGLYSPLFYSSYLAEVAATGGDEGRLARVIHLDNLLLHILTAWIVLGLLRRLLEVTGRPGEASGASGAVPALAGALLFALHPLQAESVSWATGRKDLLGWMFGFLALRSYLEWRRTGKQIHYGGAAGCFALALLSKATTAALPLAAAAVDFYVLRLPMRRSLKALAPWGAIALLFATAASRIQHVAGGVEEVMPPAWTRPLVAADSLAFYMGKVILPTGLSPVYIPVGFIAANTRLLGLSLLVVSIPLALLLSRRNLAGAGTALAVALILPTSGLVPFHYQTISTVADRYFYGAMLGVALAGAAAVRVLQGEGRRPVPATAVPALFLLPLAVLSHRQSAFWRNSEALWTRAVHVAPGSAIARNNLGMSYGELGRPEEAVKEFEEAVRLDPKLASAQTNLANAYSGIDRKEEAEEHYRKAVEADPRHLVARSNLMLISWENEQTTEAVGHARKILELDPTNLPGLTILARSLGSEGKGEEALKLLRDASARKPQDQDLKALLQQAEQILAAERR